MFYRFFGSDGLIAATFTRAVTGVSGKNYETLAGLILW